MKRSLEIKPPEKPILLLLSRSVAFTRLTVSYRDVAISLLRISRKSTTLADIRHSIIPKWTSFARLQFIDNSGRHIPISAENRVLASTFQPEIRVEQKKKRPEKRPLTAERRQVVQSSGETRRPPRPASANRSRSRGLPLVVPPTPIDTGKNSLQDSITPDGREGSFRGATADFRSGFRTSIKAKEEEEKEEKGKDAHVWETIMRLSNASEGTFTGSPKRKASASSSKHDAMRLSVKVQSTINEVNVLLEALLTDVPGGFKENRIDDSLDVLEASLKKPRPVGTNPYLGRRNSIEQIRMFGWNLGSRREVELVCRYTGLQTPWSLPGTTGKRFAHKHVHELRTALDSLHQSAYIIQRCVREFLCQMRQLRYLDELKGFVVKSASSIQSAFRGWKERQKYRAALAHVREASRVLCGRLDVMPSAKFQERLQYVMLKESLKAVAKLRHKKLGRLEGVCKLEKETMFSFVDISELTRGTRRLSL